MKRAPLRILENVGIKYKLFAAFLMVITVPFLLLLFVHLTLTERNSEKQAIMTTHKVLGETESYIEYKVRAVYEVLNFIAFNDTVVQVIETDPAQYADVNQWGWGSYQLSRVLAQSRNNPDIGSLQLYMRGGLAAATETEDYLRMDRIGEEAWFKDYASAHEVFIWLPSDVLNDPVAHAGDVAVLRKIPKPRDILHFNGIVRANLSREVLQSILDHVSFTPGATGILFNERGDVLSASRNFQFTAHELAAFTDENRKLDKARKVWDEHLLVDGKRLLYGLGTISGSDMKLAIIVPYSDILKSNQQTRNQFITIFLLIVPFTLPLSFWAAGSATKRIRQLTRHVRQVKQGNFELSRLPASADEIGQLTHHFHLMVQSISDLMTENYKMGSEIKDKELKALQAQINPHFLYNTLDLINVLAIERGAEEISRVVDELAVFYRLSLSKGEDIVTLENELKHVEAYVRIQNRRFGGGIELIIDVPCELYDCKIPKITLQPLVENSILHGILETDKQRGTIRIQARKEEYDVIITVEDNGVGMTAEQLAAIFKGNGSKKTGGFGVGNILDRIRLYYGNQYGLQFDSAPNAGTRATLRIRA
ncbi:MAG TPA: sensor histidine kinase [Bacilli bacterium]